MHEQYTAPVFIEFATLLATLSTSWLHSIDSIITNISFPLNTSSANIRDEKGIKWQTWKNAYISFLLVSVIYSSTRESTHSNISHYLPWKSFIHVCWTALMLYYTIEQRDIRLYVRHLLNSQFTCGRVSLERSLFTGEWVANNFMLLSV